MVPYASSLNQNDADGHRTVGDKHYMRRYSPADQAAGRNPVRGVIIALLLFIGEAHALDPIELKSPHFEPISLYSHFEILIDEHGGRIRDMYITTSTPVTGYTIGASGALNAVAAAICLAEETVPPHATWSQHDPACGLELVTRVRTDHVIGAVVAGYGAHGQNAAIALTQHRAAPGDELPMSL